MKQVAKTDVSHDVITDYLMNEHHTAHGLWKLVEGLIQDDPEGLYAGR